MNLVNFDDLLSGQEKIAIIGLGYVGFPLLIELAKKFSVIGFDVNEEKIATYKQGIDPTNEVGDEQTKATTAKFTANEADLREAKLFIVAVPTPLNQDHTPDLRPIISASKVVGRQMTEGSIAVFESTVYPGTTEDICLPILEEYSGLIFGTDFTIGYSPERINPGDKKHTLKTITKVVSASDEETLDTLASVYGAIVDAGIHRAESIQVAEAAKVIENAQRDINIAFMNELSIVFNKMNIDTNQVLRAARTKWNFLDFTPGLVGGHCIGVDPYYFLYKAEELGYHSQIIAAGRKVNDEMGKHIASNTVRQLILANQKVNGAKVAVLGLTFKEDVPDIRNSKVFDVIEELRTYEIDVLVCDPVANKAEVKAEFGIDLVDQSSLTNLQAIVLAVPHKMFLQMDPNEYAKFFKDAKVIIDVKGKLNREAFETANYRYWSL